ncbi:MAG: DUF11 domain-containing protein [Chloroflexi bacterium]|nr:DUF11 domain-containing protein [Chloroflexota bacterium]
MKTKNLFFIVILQLSLLAGLYHMLMVPSAAAHSAYVPAATSSDLSSLCASGVGDPNDLITAITNANADPAADTITLAAGCAYTLTLAAVPNADSYYGATGLPEIDTPITIDGNGATIVRDASSAEFRLFYVGVNGDLTLDSLTLSGGYFRGGAGPRTEDTDGGGGGGGGGAGVGGAIFNQGNITLTQTTLTGNTAHGGGDSWDSGALNDVGGGGGSIDADGVGTSGGGTAGGDGGSQGDGEDAPGFGGGGGGGGYTCASCINSKNGGDGHFGGGGGGGAERQDTISEGHGGSGGFGAGDGSNGDKSGDPTRGGRGGGGAGLGGAIFNHSGNVILINSAFYGNAVYGGDTNNNGSGFGAGIFNYHGVVQATNVTFSDNTASTGGGGIYNYGVGVSATLTMYNTLLANSQWGYADCYNNNGSVSGNNNLIENHNGCGTTNSIITDPLTAVPGNYGGNTDTVALLPGSPAIDTGDAATCATTDQRGKTRFGTCDIGAFEFQGLNVTGSSGSGQSAYMQTTFASPLSISFSPNDADDPIEDGEITWVGPASNASINPVSVIGTIDATGYVSAAVTANDYEGSYTVTGEGVSYNLTNIVRTTVCPGGIGSTAAIIKALEDANANPDASTISLAANCVYTVTVAYAGYNGLPPVTTPITIEGNGSTIVRASASDFRLFEVSATGDLTLENITLQNGRANTGGAIYGQGTLTVQDSTIANSVATSLFGANGGGAIMTSGGQLIISNSSFKNNQGYRGGAIWIRNTIANITTAVLTSNTASDNGGGLYVSDSSDVDIQRSSFVDNTANSGGGIFNDNITEITNSTFSGNDATAYYGGGVHNIGTLTVTNSTFSENDAVNGGAGLRAEGGGSTVLRNVIIANSISTSDCSNSGTIDVSINNIIEDGSCGALLTGDPDLAPLTTFNILPIYKLNKLSNAIDTGSNAFCATVDQRGVVRPVNGVCDIGAIENVDKIPVTTSDPVINDGDGLCSLIEAILNANDQVNGLPYPDCLPGDPTGEDIVELAAATTYTLTTIYASDTGLPTIDTEIIIDGNDSTISRDTTASSFRIFRVLSPGVLTIRDTTLMNGIASMGGAIYSEGTINLVRSILTNNESISILYVGGGGIMVRDGTGTINDTTFILNNAWSGGAIFTRNSNITVTNSSFITNTVNYWGGAIYIYKGNGSFSSMNNSFTGNSAAIGGGAIYAGGDSMEVIGSTFTYNQATDFGGAVLSRGIDITIRNSTFYSNTADLGGALYNSYDAGNLNLNVNNSTLSNNSANTGGGLYNNSSNTTTLQNTIIANSTSGGDCFNDGGTVNVTTNNLIEDGSCSATLTGDPELGPLADYGGDTLTMPLALSSPALNAGDNATCESTDQRGVGRFIDPVCDIGAYEGALCPTSLPVIPADDTLMLITVVNLTQLYCPGLDTITLTANSTYTFTTYIDDTDGFNALPSIVAPLTIEGNGSTLVRSSADEFRFFHVANTGSLVLNDLTMENGDIDSLPSRDRSGGAVAVFNGNLTVSNNTLINNTASGGAAIYGIGIATSITVAHTLFANNISINSDAGGRGGAFRIDDGGTATIYNSTFDSNTTDSFGGAMYTDGTVTVTNSTFNNNSSTNGSSQAGGIYTLGAFTSRNNIFANSSGGGDCYRQSGTFTAQGNNLDTDGTCLTAAGSNFITADPLLGPLQNNGGAVDTLAIGASSPALNVGDNNYAPADLVDIDNDGDTTELSPYDQRGVGFERIIGAIDLGAYEFDGGCATSVFTIADGDEAALINAIHCANDEAHHPGVDTITLTTASAYTFDGLSTPLFIYSRSGMSYNAFPPITSEIVIEGNGSIIERDSATAEEFRLFYLNSNGDLTLNAVTIRNGLSYDPSNFPDGGAIHNASGKLTINDSTFANNGMSSAGCCPGGGGAIWNKGNTAELSISNSSFISNTASWNGGAIAIFDSSIVTITNSTLSGNSAEGANSNGGGLYSDSNGVVTLENVTLTNNTAENNGDGIQVDNGTITIRNSIVANNAGTDCNGSATFIGEGNNLDSDGTCAALASSNFITALPLLDALADNGGQTLTHQPLFVSPAVNAGDPATCTSSDQRGVTRPQGSTCDIGSFELQFPVDLVINKAVTPTVAMPGQTITYTIAFSNTGVNTASGVVISDTVPPEVSVSSISLSIDNLLAYWPLNEGSGAIARDITGHGYDGTLNNDPVFTTTTPLLITVANPYALDFDGGNDYIEVDNNSGLFDLTQMSFSAWIKPEWVSDGPIGNPGFLGIRGATGSRVSLHIHKDYSGLDTYTSNGGVQFYTYPFQQGQWYHIAMTWDGVNEALYVNGALVDSYARTVDTSITTQPLVIGSSQTNHTSHAEYFPGLMDEVRVYNRALTAVEVAAQVQSSCASGQALACAIGTLAPSQSGTLTITGLISGSLGGNVITNTATITSTIAEGTLTLADNQSEAVLTASCPAGTVAYVDRDATGDNNGTSWNHAFTDLQSTLNTIYLAYCGVNEIWVAKGVYTPGTTQSDSFNLLSGLEIYGGFAATETLRTQRDWLANSTILSGDIAEDDTVDANGVVTATANIAGTNSYHVVTGSGVITTAVLDGFTITAGQANGVGDLSESQGGGMFNITGSPSLTNVTFSGNSAEFGGGMYNENSSNPTLDHVIFSGNTVTNFGGWGGGMHNHESSPTLTNVTFSTNTSIGAGGGLSNYSNSSPTLTNVTFFGNSAEFGGGMYNQYSSNPSLTSVTFAENSANVQGGGMFSIQDSSLTLTNTAFLGNSATNGGGMANHNNVSLTLTNVIFSGNSAASNGGGILIQTNSNTSLTNVTFAGNSAGNYGGGMANYSNSSPIIRNSIFWANTASTEPAIYNNNSSPVLTNTLVQGGCPTGSTCNGVLLTSNPMFVREPDSGDGNWTTLSDNDYGDLNLQSNSPAIDNGDNSFVSGVVADLAGNPRILDGDGDGLSTVDLGAYEASTHYRLTVVKDGTGSGMVTSDPAGVDCGITCTLALTSNSVVTLTAVANISFSGWSGACAGTGSCLLTMTETKKVTATFSAVNTSTLVGTVTLQGRTDHTTDLSVRFYATNNVTPTYTFTPTMSANGTFTITSTASGTYTAAVKHAQSLQVVQLITLTAGATTSYDFGELKMSDANGDNVVNIQDLSLLSGAYGTTTGDADYNPAADFNGDGIVNILDLSLLSGNYGLVGENP